MNTVFSPLSILNRNESTACFDGFISTSVVRITLSGKSYRHVCVECMWRSPVIVQPHDRTGKTRIITLTKCRYV